MSGREFLLDVSRLIWRRWKGRLPTGIDRVCLEYVEHFGARSQAVVQYKGRAVVLSPAASDRLFELVRGKSGEFRLRVAALLGPSWITPSRSPPQKGMIYLNVGHTGLDQAGLVRWVAHSDVKAVYLVHDLIPITHPQFCRAGEAAKHILRMSNALASAAGFICNSEMTRNALRSFAQDRALDMPASIVAWISGPPELAALSPKKLERPFFVTLGTIEGRKNHLLLLRVWKRLASRLGAEAPVLVVIGQRGWEADEAITILNNLGELQEHVRELHRCDDDDVASWIAGARGLLMPSFAEGFGLPVVEALQLQVPVIATNLPVYHEIAGAVPTYLDPGDLLGWERVIEDFLANGPERSRQTSALQKFKAKTWADHFASVEWWLEQLRPAIATAP